jgi:hypothetical protein
LAPSPLRLMTSNSFFQLNTCFHSPYVTSPLKRGWVCHLQTLLALASADILRSESHGTHDHILLSQIWDFHNLEGEVPIFISPRNRVVQLYPQALGSNFIASYDSQGYGGGTRPYLLFHFNFCLSSPYVTMAQTAQKTLFLTTPTPTAVAAATQQWAGHFYMFTEPLPHNRQWLSSYVTLWKKQ